MLAEGINNKKKFQNDKAYTNHMKVVGQKKKKTKLSSMIEE